MGTGSVVVNETGDVWSVRVYGAFLRQEIFGDLVRRDPNVVGTSQVHLVYRTILLAPVGKLDKTILLRNFRYDTNDWVA